MQASSRGPPGGVAVLARRLTVDRAPTGFVGARYRLASPLPLPRGRPRRRASAAPQSAARQRGRRRERAPSSAEQGADGHAPSRSPVPWGRSRRRAAIREPGDGGLPPSCGGHRRPLGRRGASASVLLVARSDARRLRAALPLAGEKSSAPVGAVGGRPPPRCQSHGSAGERFPPSAAARPAHATTCVRGQLSPRLRSQSMADRGILVTWRLGQTASQRRPSSVPDLTGGSTGFVWCTPTNSM